MWIYFSRVKNQDQTVEWMNQITPNWSDYLSVAFRSGGRCIKSASTQTCQDEDGSQDQFLLCVQFLLLRYQPSSPTCGGFLGMFIGIYQCPGWGRRSSTVSVWASGHVCAESTFPLCPQGFLRILSWIRGTKQSWVLSVGLIEAYAQQTDWLAQWQLL